jgi:hypothetical protein
MLGFSKKAAASPAVNEYFHLTHKHLAAANASRDLAHSYARQLVPVLSARIRTLAKTEGSVPLKSILLLPSYTAAVRALLGSAFPAERTLDDFLFFDSTTAMLAIGAPEFVVYKTRAAWRRIMETLMEYIEKGLPEDACALAVEEDNLFKDYGAVSPTVSNMVIVMPIMFSK